jgi:L-threonylcarbamoyladenylate synthase
MHTTIGTDIHVAIELLKAAQTVAIPTETVYGLAANALNPDAVLAIFKAKNRPHFNPLILHFPDWQSVWLHVEEIPPAAYALASAFMPGPLTLLLTRKNTIPDLVTAGSPKVAVRVPSHPLAHQLLAALPFPLAAPSANPFGYVSPTRAEHVLLGLQGRIPYILDGGPCQVGLESTIVDFEGKEVIIRRKGGVSIQEIEKTIGAKVLVKTDAADHPVAPGQLQSHYATTIPLYVGDVEENRHLFAGRHICIMDFGESRPAPDISLRLQLSERADLDEAAKHLFQTMREADKSGADVILINWLPEEGIGSAINDRLKRAACQD